MKIVLDSNILRTDPQLHSGHFRVLIDYATKTQSQFVMPRIVFEEAKANYGRQLAGAIDAYNVSLRKINKILMVGKIDENLIQAEKQVENYGEKLKSVFRFSEQNIFEYRDSYLSDVMKRAVNRIPPCSEKGEEIRDAVLWLGLLDIAETSYEKAVIFISNDKSAFASPDEKLRPELLDECKQRQVEVKYFTSLERFAAIHAVTIEFVTLEWINENFTAEKVLGATDSKLEFVAKNALKRKLERDYHNENISSTGHVNRISSEIDIESFFVNELSDGSLQITVDYRGEVEFECEVEVTDDAGNTDYDYKYVYPEVILSADILVKDTKIVEWSAADIW